MKNKFDVMNDMTASRQQSDFTYSLQPETQGMNSILWSILFQNANLIGGIDRRDVFGLPHECVDEN